MSLEDINNSCNHPESLAAKRLPTFREFVDGAYWVDKANLAKKTKETYRGYIDRILMPRFADMCISDIGYTDVQAMINDCRTRKIAHDARAVLSSILGHASKNHHLLPFNIAEGNYIYPSAEPNPEFHAFGVVLKSFEDIVEWIERIKKLDSTGRVYRAALTGLGLGLRPQETCGLDEDSINLDDGYVRVFQAYTYCIGGSELKPLKTAEYGCQYRELPIPDYLIRAFADLNLKTGPYIKKASGQREDTNMLGKTFRKMRVRNALPRLTCETMRHSFGTTCIKEQIMTIDMLARWLGHASANTTRKSYVLLDYTDLKQEVDSLNMRYLRYAHRRKNSRACLAAGNAPKGYFQDVMRIPWLTDESVKVTSRDGAILDALMHDPTLTTESLARIIGVSLATIKRDTKRLAENGLLVRAGSRKKGTWIVSQIHPSSHKETLPGTTSVESFRNFSTGMV